MVVYKGINAQQIHLSVGWLPSLELVQNMAHSRTWRAAIALIVTTLLLFIFGVPLGARPGRPTEQNPWHALRYPSSLTAASNVDWSEYAYSQYATSTDYLCNSLLIFESLGRPGSKPSRVMMYPDAWSTTDATSRGRLLLKARDEYRVILQPVVVQHYSENGTTWADIFTKLLAFNQTAFQRVLSLDSDATVVQPLDELFLMPPAPVAMPRAYWLTDKPTLSSQLVLVEPSKFEMSRVLAALRHRKYNEFDMEIVNDLYGKNCIVIPHRRYDLLSGEFRNTEHSLYLGSNEESWDPDAAYQEAKFLHFSDWPLPKPWLPTTQKQIDEVVPACWTRDDGTQDCRDRDRWLLVYEDFLERREGSDDATHVCGSEFMPSRRDHNVNRSFEKSAWSVPESLAAFIYDLRCGQQVIDLVPIERKSHATVALGFGAAFTCPIVTSVQHVMTTRDGFVSSPHSPADLSSTYYAIRVRRSGYSSCDMDSHRRQALTVKSLFAAGPPPPLQLPGELRSSIYELVLLQSGGVLNITSAT
ncbi:glycosyltransferase family 8 protein [Dothistroma septosporum NZE10]|uniref:Glycosyltransferase family 8 protein n=1 Tax=Dothistroma septosporum (strain NZE10 / CBS 128990) TaxID=675120 RepID=N1PPF8_DOTSN|nr:glycosyltransferase family 8 protein [Dothistroma septosporum NZE10]